MSMLPRSFVPIALLALGLVGCAAQQTQPQEEAAAPAATAAAATAAPAPDAEAIRAAQVAAAENQRMLTEARGLLDQARGYAGMNSDQSARMREAEAAMASGDGRRAFDILNGLLSELKSARMTYAVVGGDSLWRISGKNEVYGNPFQWPLIYKANSDKIRDADLIHPGLELNVNKAPTQAEADAAVHHAKTRGAWSIGAVEESDKAYLSSGN